MERKIVIAAFLIVLVLLSPIFISIKADTGSKPPKRGPKLIPEDEMPQPCFLKYGKLPEFKDEDEETRWLELLAKLADRLDGPDVPYAGTLVVAHGAGGDGYYWVWFRDPKDAVQNVIATIAEEINRVAKEVGFDVEVPIKFAHATGKGGYDKERDEPWDTMIGGLQIRDTDRGWWMTSTLGWSAKKTSDGTKGFVIAGHIGYNRRVPVGTMIYQPDTPYETSTVQLVAGRSAYADVAWVQFSNVAPEIYIGGIGMSISWYEDPYVDETVYKSGITTDITYGTVLHVGVDEHMDDYCYEWLYDQAIADYGSARGDSGAPVYIVVSGYGRGMVGIHSGNSITYGGCKRFSPCSGVEEEIGVVPLTIYD